MKPSHITINEAAKILGKSRVWVGKLIEQGRLPAVKSGESFLVEREAVENFKPNKPGRPKT